MKTKGFIAFSTTALLYFGEKLINTNYLHNRKRKNYNIDLLFYIYYTFPTFVSIPDFYAFLKSEYVFSTLYCIMHSTPENASSEG